MSYLNCAVAVSSVIEIEDVEGLVMQTYHNVAHPTNHTSMMTKIVRRIRHEITRPWINQRVSRHDWFNGRPF